MARRRLDDLLVARGLAPDRDAAARLVMAGLVLSGSRRLEKPGETVRDDLAIDVRRPEHPFVSRGGVKLAAALDAFVLDCVGVVALDVGASTGGFTDCLLQRGATRVYAVDSGSNQLAWKLRGDPRVVSLERVSIRAATTAQIPEPVAAIVCDVSFAPLREVLPAALTFAAPGAWLVVLVKPQFEAARHEVGDGGIVRDPHIHERTVAAVSDWVGARPCWRVLGTMQSPIEGAEGNREFLLAARHGAG
ncbi:MAG: TlyA family RNA methyltransferase [Alphaproteobacteria bacterium]|nr:TlyA family RNA methyltransferase [Alphaproteobacteria bacterium]